MAVKLEVIPVTLSFVYFTGFKTVMCVCVDGFKAKDSFPNALAMLAICSVGVMSRSCCDTCFPISVIVQSLSFSN